MPDVKVPQHDGFNNTGIFDFTYKLECDRNFAGVCLLVKNISFSRSGQFHLDIFTNSLR